MHEQRKMFPLSRRAKMGGLTLIELLVATTIGLIITIAVGTVFLSGNSGARRQAQLSLLQQSVRTAFDYLARDARMVGHLGCNTGSAATTFTNLITPTDITNNYAIGVEGYDYLTAGNAYTLTSNAPVNSTTVSNWATNVASAGVNTLPLTTLIGSASGDGLTPGSDVLLIRTISGTPVRLTADTVAGSSALAIENSASGGLCSDGTTAKVSGFCPITSGISGSHGLIASCTRAQTFSVNSIAGNTLTISGALSATAYPAATTEVFPMQTVAYYVKRSSSGTTTSLYRRIFDGDHVNGMEQELIEGVEMLQVRYGVDTTTPDADGVIDGQYIAANAVADWNRVVAIRMGLLLRAPNPLDSDITASTAGIPLNGITVTPPNTGRSFDRRVFTTTVAVRNRISYL